MKGDIFKHVLFPKVGRNKFDLSHSRKMSFNMGELIPSCVMDVVPGDKFIIRPENFLRFAPLVSPVMHKINVTTHYFFVPNRLLWSGWEDFITGESTASAPYCEGLPNVTPGTIGDYLMYPQGSTSAAGLTCSPMALAAYLLIYDEFYRDQNLQTTEQFVPLNAGDNDVYETKMSGDPLKRAWNHDYFTSCLPFAQKGDEVTLPLLQDQKVDVTFKTGLGSGGPGQNILDKATDLPVLNSTLGSTTDSELQDAPNTTDVRLDISNTHEVDITDEVTTINTLRRAFRLQEWLERNARAGTRYIENIFAHFGVSSSDKRMQRPEYIGGSRQNMVISEVLSTAQTVDQMSNDVPVGYMAGHGISVGGSAPIKYSAEEHGWIIGIINVQPVTGYQQGLPKMHTRFDKLDYYWPSFANIGEQEVLVKEVYCETGTGGQLGQTFGYISRYAEYKYMNDSAHGEMKTNLSFWTLNRIFDDVPALNSDFITCDPSRRIFAVTEPGADTIYAHVHNHVTAIRKMPKFGVPSI